MEPTLNDIKLQTEALAKKKNAPQELLPTNGRTQDGALPHVEIKNGQLYLVVVERGQELSRELATDTNDLLYKIFDSVTFSMACKTAGRRMGNVDFRRQLFLKQEALLGDLSEAWKIRREQEHGAILQLHPFYDNTNVRADYCKKLTDGGMPAAAAWEEACKKYPLP